MLRRLGLGILALSALGLVTVGTVAAQDGDTGSTGAASTGMGMPGMGMGPMGMPGMGLPGTPMMGMGMFGLGMPGMGMSGMGMSRTGMSGTTSAGWTTLGPITTTNFAGMWGMGGVANPDRPRPWTAFRTVIHHPGDLSGIVPCTGCGAIFDPCTFGGRCQYMEAGLWPDDLGLHPTTNRYAEAIFYPQGPLLCGRTAANNPAGCIDAPGEWNLRAGMPSASGGTSSTSR